MKFSLFWAQARVALFFIVQIHSSVEYVSLKALCHYGDVTVPEETQKKIYGILAPLFSQQPWAEEYPEKQISVVDYPEIQAVTYVLNLHTLPKEIASKIFGSKLFKIRQYKNYYNGRTFFIPFLYENKVWVLEDECALLGHYLVKSCYPHYSIKLSVFKWSNDETFPIAVLKMKQKGMVACLFLYGFISIVDLNTMKETWKRKWKIDHHKITYDDRCGVLITGYNNMICFLDRGNNRFKFYTISDLINQKSYSYKIQNKRSNQKFEMMHVENFGSPRAMNSTSFFYAFFKKNWHQNGPYSCWVYSPVDEDKVSQQLYYIAYKIGQKTEKVFYTLKDDEGFFEHIVCNDICLMARDNENRIYVWDLRQPIDVLPRIIQDTDSMLFGVFWLDNASDKILAANGVFKIQNVFEGLPTVSHQFILKNREKVPKQQLESEIKPENPKDPEERLNCHDGCFKKLCMRIYWFIQFLYQAIKKRNKHFYEWVLNFF